MESNKIAVSIIMPVYNSEKYLKSCVDSILSQDFDSYELLLIDDGSTDGSPEICDDIARRDTRVRVFHKENGGICEARNYGLQWAQGEYIAFSDHDDIVLPGFLSENYKVAKENDADIVKFGRKALYIEENQIKRTDIRQFKKEILSVSNIKANYFRLRFENAMTCIWDGLYRKAFLISNSLMFDTRFKKGGEDIDFCGKCFSVASVLVFNDGVYYEHYIRKGYSTSTKRDDNQLMKFQMLVDNLNESCQRLKLSKEDTLYKMCIMKELVYPTLSYFASIKEKNREIDQAMSEIHEQYFSKKIGFLRFIAVDKKWGIFTWLFEIKQFRFLFGLTKIRTF